MCEETDICRRSKQTKWSIRKHGSAQLLGHLLTIVTMMMVSSRSCESYIMFSNPARAMTAICYGYEAMIL